MSATCDYLAWSADVLMITLGSSRHRKRQNRKGCVIFLTFKRSDSKNAGRKRILPSRNVCNIRYFFHVETIIELQKERSCRRMEGTSSGQGPHSQSASSSCFRISTNGCKRRRVSNNAGQSCDTRRNAIIRQLKEVLENMSKNSSSKQQLDMWSEKLGEIEKSSLPWTVIAVIGITGSGKSSLLNA